MVRTNRNGYYEPDQLDNNTSSYENIATQQPQAQMGIAQPVAPSELPKQIELPIGKAQIQKATVELMKYKAGKAMLETRVVENEEWYRLRHWECMRRKKNDQVKPVSAWLFNCLANKLADMMDNYPSPNILPREEMDMDEAKMLSSIIPVILKQDDFEQTYKTACGDKLKGGTGIYGVFFDKSKLNGLGDVSIVSEDILNVFWQPGVTDIQKSKNFFHVALEDNDSLIAEYPQLEGKLGSSTISLTEYVHDDSIDTSEQSAVVDWYYKKRDMNGREVLHYCKFVNDEVLFATENEPEFAQGWYMHGMYPYIFDPLFSTKGTPAGFGYIDIAKNAQEYIDTGNQALMQNLLVNSKPRFLARNDAVIDMKKFADLTCDIIPVNGNLSKDSVVPITAAGLSSVYVEVMNNKIDELKEVTGNRDVTTGGTTGGVTAASGIAALQESASRLARMDTAGNHFAYEKLIIMVIELIRQFYTAPRCFRITGEAGAMAFVNYSNANLAPQYQGMDFSIDMGTRKPLFDIDVQAEKQSPYSKLSQNELALQFYGAGFFAPAKAVEALACLDMMDFDGKEHIMQGIAKNGDMYQQMAMLAEMCDNAMGTGGEISASLAQQYGMDMPNSVNPEAANPQEKESKVTKQARQRTAEASTPR